MQVIYSLLLCLISTQSRDLISTELYVLHNVCRTYTQKTNESEKHDLCLVIFLTLKYMLEPSALLNLYHFCENPLT